MYSSLLCQGNTDIQALAWPSGKGDGFRNSNRNKQFARARMWHGRVGAVHLYQPPRELMPGMNVWVVGVHLAHADNFEDSIIDLALVLSRRPRGAAILVQGDFNVDILPTLETDPFHYIHNRGYARRSDRHFLEQALQLARASIVVPSASSICPGGDFAEQCLAAPITRLPHWLAGAHPQYH